MDFSTSLSPAGKAKVKALSGPRPRQFVEALASAWAVIVTAVACASYFQSPSVTVVAILLIASRQQMLALLLHEQTHYLGMKGRHGDSFVNLLVAYPLLVVSVEGYSDIHLRHHRYYFTPQDPDFIRKNGWEWTFPMPALKLIGLFLRDITGISFVQYVFRPKTKAADAPAIKRKNRSPRWLRPLFMLVLVSALTIAGEWKNFLLLWALPLMFIFPAIVRWGAICEHIYGQEDASVSSSSPLITPTLLNRLLLPNLNFSMHPYHHYFPGVSFSNLPAVHDIFVEEKLVNTDLAFDGYGDYLRYILGFRRGYVGVARTTQAEL
jgi:fatty acid desaturase